MEIKTEFGFFPWARATYLAQIGEWDGVVAWTRQPAFENDFYYSDPVYEGKHVFFHLKSNPFDWNSIEDLEGMKVGGIISYEYSKDIRQGIEDGIIEMEYVSKEILNFRKLLAGRIDIFPENIEVGYHILNANFPPEVVKLFTHHPKPSRELPYHLLLTRKRQDNERVMDLFNYGLKILRESGKYDEYLSEFRQDLYLLEDN